MGVQPDSGWVQTIENGLFWIVSVMVAIVLAMSRGVRLVWNMRSDIDKQRQDFERELAISKIQHRELSEAQAALRQGQGEIRELLAAQPTRNEMRDEIDRLGDNLTDKILSSIKAQSADIREMIERRLSN
jgi:hypothetical protein